MAIGTVIADRAQATFPVGSGGPAGVLHVAWGTYNIAAVTAAADVIKFCRLPAGATVVDGRLYGADIDTGTEAWDMDIGWEANGDEIADPDGFGNFGVISGDALDGGEVGVERQFGGVLRTAGPKTFNRETIISGTVVAAANAGGTGRVTCVVYYTVA